MLWFLPHRLHACLLSIKVTVERSSKHQSGFILDVSCVRQVFHVPLEERKYKDINQFGEGDQAKVCVDIMHKTGAHLELSLAKDQGLSIMVSGKLDAVMKARKEIVSRLQTQVQRAHFNDNIFKETSHCGLDTTVLLYRGVFVLLHIEC